MQCFDDLWILYEIINFFYQALYYNEWWWIPVHLTCYINSVNVHTFTNYFHQQSIWFHFTSSCASSVFLALKYVHQCNRWWLCIYYNLVVKLNICLINECCFLSFCGFGLKSKICLINVVDHHHEPSSCTNYVDQTPTISLTLTLLMYIC